MILVESMKAYLANPAMGAGTASLGMESLRLLKDEREGLVKHSETDATAFGTAFHARILEPDLFQSLLSEGPINDKTGKCYGRDTKAWAAWEADNPGRIVLDAEEMATLLYMQERMPDEVRRIFTNPNARREISVYQDFDGLAVKCRPDDLTDQYITDLKTIDDIGNIRRAVRQRRYWFSQAWYKRLMMKETGRERKHRLVFAEKKPPFRWKIVDENPDRIEQSMMRVQGVLSMIQSAVTLGDWSDTGNLHMNLSWEDCGVFEDDELIQTEEGISL